MNGNKEKMKLNKLGMIMKKKRMYSMTQIGHNQMIYLHHMLTKKYNKKRKD